MVGMFEHHEKHRVECAKRHARVLLHELQEALLHLHRGGFCERNHQYIRRVHPVLLDQILCSGGNHGGLAAAGTGENHHGAILVLDGRKLGFIKIHNSSTVIFVITVFFFDISLHGFVIRCQQK